MEEVQRVLVRSPPKTCMLDSIPTDVLLEFIDITPLYITIICYASLKEGSLPVSLKAAIITPILKKRGLEADDVKSYRYLTSRSFRRSLSDLLLCK